MSPDVCDDEPNFDDRDLELMALLKTIFECESSVVRLLRWIQSESREFIMGKALDNAIPKQSITEQITDCQGLNQAANYILERMRSLGSLTSAMHEVRSAYVASNLESGKDEHSLYREWSELEVRVASDMKLLARLAQLTQINLNSLQKKTGRPSTKSRDVLFHRWYQQLQQSSMGGSDLVEVAVKGWNLYFVRDKFISAGAAKQALERIGGS